MTSQHQHTAQVQGASEILDGCGACCDGVVQQLRATGVSQNAINLIEQARDLCRRAAEEVRRQPTS